jgi:hypothetical protein
VLPVVRDEIPLDRGFDELALILETRFLQPLHWFGLAEARASPREPDELIAPVAYRKAPLFDRVVSFRVPAAGRAGRDRR